MNRAAAKIKPIRPEASWMVTILILTVALPCFAQGPAKSTARQRARRLVLVSIADRKLAVIENGMVLAYFPVAVGSAVSPSPTGEFQIVSRVANPTYFHNGVVMMPGRDNPVGTRWMGLNVKGYGIHGTNAPGSVGHATSHGCIRLRNRDVERLYSMLRVGDIVEIHKERDPEIVQMFGAPLDVAKAQVSGETVGQ